MLFLFNEQKNIFINTKRIIKLRHYKLASDEKFVVEVQLAINDLKKEQVDKEKVLFDYESEALAFIQQIDLHME